MKNLIRSSKVHAVCLAVVFALIFGTTSIVFANSALGSPGNAPSRGVYFCDNVGSANQVVGVVFKSPVALVEIVQAAKRANKVEYSASQVPALADGTVPWRCSNVIIPLSGYFTVTHSISAIAGLKSLPDGTDTRTDQSDLTTVPGDFNVTTLASAHGAVVQWAVNTTAASTCSWMALEEKMTAFTRTWSVLNTDDRNTIAVNCTESTQIAANQTIPARAYKAKMNTRAAATASYVETVDESPHVAIMVNAISIPAPGAVVHLV